MIKHHVDPRPGHERHEPFQELHGREDEMGRPVRPRPLQGDGDPPVAQPVQPSLPERRTAEVLAEPFEPLAIARGDVHGRMEVEAGIVVLADLTKRGKMDPTSLTPWAGAVSMPPSS